MAFDKSESTLISDLTLWTRHLLAWRSFRRLPGWVQVWVGCVLVPVNVTGLLFWEYPAGRWIGLAALVVFVINYLIMLVESGMSRLMSVPHILVWGPLEIALLYSMWLGSLELEILVFTATVVIINGISLVFDLRDFWLWTKGDREIT